MSTPVSGRRKFVAPRLAGAGLVAAAILASCGSAGPSRAPASYAPGSPVISANNQKFDRDTLAVPAGAPFQLVLDNQDSAPHNVAFYADDTFKTPLWVGDIEQAHTLTVYSVPALAAGTYAFRCDVHPALMKGRLTVGG